jgi:hypothetical protein
VIDVTQQDGGCCPLEAWVTPARPVGIHSVEEAPPRRREWGKWILVGLGILVVAAGAVGVSIVTGHHTDCYADFPSTAAAKTALAEAEARGLHDADLVARPRSASIAISSGETGDDARDFRLTVRRVVRAEGGHLERNTPCIERPYFD